ncbi:NAD(P)/FAD-dependent oxidoreductase [Paucibacter sp. APW11]|uniref:NAD(P)/FAD-dependent oxidoreductase n=1 Tax=Roseateles aquae TaxID=3077235 RepID=A0ABU3PFY6_9BURK|nr:NAD(P)/FAD-dependent oxidoreductase [Paucibacter sp. APW11]MDT9001003.1 NAD(P)/FAD-dependent oxidoreductase [Paucibacter sp. APW11]
MKTDVLIAGAGPAGLTAGLELLRAGKQNVTIVEASREIGGLSRTVNFKGNRIDIGGHRFFSKSDWVMDWWRDLLPIAMPEALAGDEKRFRLGYQGAAGLLGHEAITATEAENNVMLVRSRLSRIYFGGNFFDYPLRPGLDMVAKMGVGRCVGFAGSYAWSALKPIAPENSLEDFFINRFGRQLYLQFFKEYTEKVWGVSCREISAAWGAQRVKSLSIGKALMHAARKAVTGQAKAEQTSLIESFLYPKYGPGQMWEVAAAEFERLGGRLMLGCRVDELHCSEGRVDSVRVCRDSSEMLEVDVDQFISTMPVRDLICALRPVAESNVLKIAKGLQYRDFITVGLLYKNLRRGSAMYDRSGQLVRDNWIYIQEPGVKVGRLQVFNNWSPYMVADQDSVWLGLEFFARDDDELWLMSDADIMSLAIQEMQQLGLADAGAVLDATVIRMPKAYPGYFGESYEKFDLIRAYLDQIPNLFLIGRNGMHRYNNQDHSMLSAKLAAQAILRGAGDKSSIWAVNIDDEYHEESK